MSTNKLTNIFITVIMIIFSGHAVQTMFVYGYYVLIALAAVALLFITVNIVTERIDLPRAAMLLFAVMILCTAIADAGKGLFTYLMVGANIILAVFVVERISFSAMVDVFLKIMTVVTIISLIGYFLANNTAVLNFLPTVKNNNGVEYVFGVIFSYIKHIPERNCGMFWEPGLFATYLVISFVFELIFKGSKPSVLRLILFSIGIITANSSAGFVLWFFCLLLIIAKKRENKKQNMIFGMISLILLLLVPVLALNLDAIIQNTPLAGNEYIQKLLSDNLQDQSRILAIQHNLEIFFENPFFGAGIVYTSQNMQYVADTSTSTYLLSVFGILGALYTVFWVYGIFRQKNINLFTKIILTVIMISILNKEPHVQILFTWCLLMYFLKGNNLVKNPTEEPGLMNGEKKNV